MKPDLKIEFRQMDWEPGFAGYLDDGQPNGTAFCFLNLGSLLCAVEKGDLPRADLPYMIAESMMHEIIHTLEAWAKVEFSEERVEDLLVKYREAAGRSGTFWHYDPAAHISPSDKYRNRVPSDGCSASGFLSKNTCGLPGSSSSSGSHGSWRNSGCKPKSGG